MSLAGINISNVNALTNAGWIDASAGDLSIQVIGTLQSTGGYIGSHKGKVSLEAGALYLTSTVVGSETGTLTLSGTSVALQSVNQIYGKEIAVDGNTLWIGKDAHLGLHDTLSQNGSADIYPGKVTINSSNLTIDATKSEQNGSGVDGTDIVFNGSSITMNGDSAHISGSGVVTLGSNEDDKLISIKAETGGDITGNNIKLNAHEAIFNQKATISGTTGVEIHAPSLVVDNGSSVSSLSGSVTISLPNNAGEDAELSIQLDQDSDDSVGTIQGVSVSIGSESSSTTVSGGIVTANGSGASDKVTIRGNSVNVDGSAVSSDKGGIQLDAGSGGVKLTDTNLKSTNT